MRNGGEFSLLAWPQSLSLTLLFTGISAPIEHPVRRTIGAHGNPQLIGPSLNHEMELSHEIFGPFHFTRSYLVYEPGYTLNVVPFDVIVAAEVVVGGGDDAPKIVVTTRDGKTYNW